MNKKLIITMIAIAFSLSAFSAEVNLLGQYGKVGKPNVYAYCVGGMVIFYVQGTGSTSLQLLNEDSKPMTCEEFKEN